MNFSIDRLRVKLRLHFPWYALLADLVRWEEDTSIETACTNGVWVKFNPDWMSQWDSREQMFVVIHELMHIILKHQLRRGDRDPQLFNYACDYRINLELADERNPHYTMPSKGLLDRQYVGMTEYQIYELLAQNPPTPEQMKGKASMGDVEDKPSTSDSGDGDGESEDGDTPVAGEGPTEEDINNAIQKGAVLQELAGKGSGLLSQLAGEARKAKVNWKHPLRKFITNEFPAFRAWQRVDHRMLATGIVYPGVAKQNQAELLFAIDTSGSMSDVWIKQLMAEVKAAFAQCELGKVHVLFFDGKVWRHDIYRKGQDFECPESFSRGGTNFKVMLEYVKENCPNIKAAIIGTDGYDTFPTGASFPVLWAGTRQFTPPFGEFIHVK